MDDHETVAWFSTNRNPDVRHTVRVSVTDSQTVTLTDTPLPRTARAVSQTQCEITFTALDVESESSVKMRAGPGSRGGDAGKWPLAVRTRHWPVS